MSAAPSRSSWPWTPDDDRDLVRRKYGGECDKAIARSLGRTPSAVNNRFRILRGRLEREFGPVLRKHRQEELALMRKLLAEARLPDGGER